MWGFGNEGGGGWEGKSVRRVREEENWRWAVGEGAEALFFILADP